jgi:hypothetical protein
MRLNERIFQNPPSEYRGVTLWMLNDKLEPEEAIQQLKGFHSAGWGAVITRTFMGLRTPYLSEEWLALTEKIIKVSKDLGVKVWLQEADKNAVSYMPTSIPGMEERFRHKRLIKRGKSKRQQENEELIAIEGDLAFYQYKVLPPGDWADLLCVLDLMDPETVRSYLEKAYKPLFERFGEEFGKTIEAIWVDEPTLCAWWAPQSSLPWTPDLPKLFEKEWKYSLLENILSLFSDVNDFQRVRHHFWRTVTERLQQAYFQQVGDWCAKHNIKFAGHLLEEDTLNSQITWSGATMPYYEFMQLPGIDHLTLDLNWPAGDPFIMTPKQCSSIAHQLGQKEVLAEMYGTSTEGITFEDRKCIGDWLAVLGISYRCYHGSFYSLRGRRKRFYVPHLSYQQSWWQNNRLIADYFARLCYVLREGKYQSDILVLHPLESAYCVYDPAIESQKVKALNESVVSLSDNLLKIQRDFDYGDESTIARYGKVTGNSLSIGKMNYMVVVLPSLITLRKSTIELLKEFLKVGGNIFSVGELPSRIDGIVDEAITALDREIWKVENTPQKLKEALDKLIPAKIEVICTNGATTETILIHSRQLGNTHLFFLVNVSRKVTVETEVRIRGSGKIEYWNLQTGKVERISHRRKGEFMITKLVFPPAGSHLLLLNETEEPVIKPEEKWKISQKIPLSDTYQIKRHDPNALTLDFCRYREENGAWSEKLPLIGIQELLNQKRYIGPVHLQFEFFAESKPKKIFVVIEDAEKYEIQVNNKKVRYEGFPYYCDISFHPIDIIDAVQVGKNTIQVSGRFEYADPHAQKNLERLYGTELESIYLVGDFAVRGTLSQKQEKTGVLRYHPEFVITDEKGTTNGDLTLDGYPFFNGRISLSQTVTLPTPKEGERFFLEMEQVNGVLARIRVNKTDAGMLIWRPYRLEITQLVQKGKNEVEIELTNSLRNLLGPHHNTNGEPVSTMDIDFSGKKDGSDWLSKRKEGKTPSWTDDYFFVPFGLNGKITIIIESSAGYDVASNSNLTK